MKKRILCMALISAMMVSALGSCSGTSSSSTSSSESKTETSASDENDSTTAESGDSSEETAEASTGYVPDFDEDPYTVHFQYLVTADSAGQDAVNEAVNELALSEMNMNVDMIPQTFGTWATTLSMMLAADESLDLFIGGSGSAATYIESGYVLDWTDYLDYVPDVVEGMGEDLEAGYVGDFLIGFSQMKERGYQPGLIVRADIMDELGISVDDFSITTEDYSTYDQLTELFAKVKEAYPDMTVLGGLISLASMGSDFADNLGDNFGMLENFGQTTTVTNWYETDQCMTFCKLFRTWFESGYESADVATNQDGGSILLKAGKLFSYFTNIKPNSTVEAESQTGYRVYAIPVSQNAFSSSSTVNASMYMLANASEDPVKAAAFYNWIYTSAEFEDLINWGVEGTNWVEASDGTAAYPDGVDASTSTYHNDFGFVYPNQFIGHAWTGNDADVWDQYEEYNASLLRSKAFGFTYDSTVITDQLAACTSVLDQYDNDIFLGAVDPEEGLANLNEALYAAGLQDIIDAKQEQLDAWLAEN